MSAHTLDWLETFTLQSRAVWHTGDIARRLGNIYDGAIPIEDVRKKLFSWKAIEAPLITEYPEITDSGVETIRIIDPNGKVIVRPGGALSGDEPRYLTDDQGRPEFIENPAYDKGAVLGVFKKGYQPHNYDEWLLKEVAAILDDDLDIYSAGLLKDGAQAWVQVSVPETITTPEGVTFKPNLLAVTSFDGSLATTYKRTVTNTVCDNTMGMALAEIGDQFKVRHSRYSNMKLAQARDALALVHTIADDFAKEVAELSSVKVSAGDWEKFLNELTPLKDENGDDKKGRGLTLATNKRDELNRLYQHDDRVAPWQGTAYGVMQAVNTYTHHSQSVKGDRMQRNQTMAVTGGFDKLDVDTTNMILAIAG